MSGEGRLGEEEEAYRTGRQMAQVRIEAGGERVAIGRGAIPAAGFGVGAKVPGGSVMCKECI